MPSTSLLVSDEGQPTRRPVAEFVATIEGMAPRKIALYLYLLALLVVLAVGFGTHFRASPKLLEADEWEYFDLSDQIMAGTWSITPRRTIGFPLIVAAIRSVTSSFLLLQVIVAAIYAASVPAMFALGRRMTGASVAGVGAALMLMLWPTGLFYGTSLYSETAALPVFLAALATLPAGSRVLDKGRARLGLSVVAGMLLGLCAHIRPMYLLYLPLLAIVLLMEERRWSISAKRIVAVLCGFMILVLPWSIYTSSRFDRPIILTSNGGETLAGGLTPRLLQMKDYDHMAVEGRVIWVGPGKWLSFSDNGYLTKAESNLPYEQTDALLQKRAFAWAAANPGDALKIEGYKLLYMWGIYPFFENGTRQMLLGNVPLLGLLALSLFLLLERPANGLRYTRLWSLALFVSGVAMISWGSWRFRQPADAGLLAFCAVALWDRYARRASPQLSPGAGSAR